MCPTFDGLLFVPEEGDVLSDLIESVNMDVREHFGFKYVRLAQKEHVVQERPFYIHFSGLITFYIANTKNEENTRYMREREFLAVLQEHYLKKKERINMDIALYFEECVDKIQAEFFPGGWSDTPEKQLEAYDSVLEYNNKIFDYEMASVIPGLTTFLQGMTPEDLKIQPYIEFKKKRAQEEAERKKKKQRKN